MVLNVAFCVTEHFLMGHAFSSFFCFRFTQQPQQQKPGICMATAILLKERNKKLHGVQSRISTLLYSSHLEKQVCALLYKIACIQ